MRVFLIAGEASGDKLGAALMAGLKQLAPGVEFLGVGGPEMQAAGLSSLFEMNELSVMGLVEVLPKYRQLKRRIAQTADAILAEKPDVLITIDNPDFCLRVAALVKAKSDTRVVHYVAPSVWAWRPGRAVKMARYVDQVLALLPFEPPLMEAAGMRCDFVGHPVVSEPVVSAQERADFRATFGLGDAPVILALPGSRKGEVSRLAPIFGQALELVLRKQPNARVLVVAASGVVHDVEQGVADWPGQPIILDPRDVTLEQGEARKRTAYGAADVALAASGTVSLELAAATTPTVVAYKVNWLTWQIMSRMAETDTATLTNIVSQTRTVPEFLGPKCQPDLIADAMIALLAQAPLRERQIAAMQQTMIALGAGGQAPGLRAAQAVLDGLK